MQCYVKEGGKPRGVFFFFFFSGVCMCVWYNIDVVDNNNNDNDYNGKAHIHHHYPWGSFVILSEVSARKHCTVPPHSIVLHFILRYVPLYHQVSL